MVPTPALLLAYDFPPIGGGIARALGEIARHAPAGSLTVSTGRMPGSEGFDAGCPAPVDRVPVPSERLRTWYGLAAWSWRARSLARERGAEFLWAGNLKPAGHVARHVGRRQDLPYGLIVYGLDVQLLLRQAEEQPARRRRAAGIVGDASGAVAISHWTASRYCELARALGVPAAAERLRVVPPGVDGERFRPGLGSETIRLRYGLDRRPWLLTVARLQRHKGVDRGLEVLRWLRQQGLDLGYAIAGEGPARPELERKAEELGVAPHVRWLGPVPEADLPALYGAATVYLGLSRQEGPQAEGFGLALLEAQASGVPVVAGAGGGTVDAVTHGVTGFVVETRDEFPAGQSVQALLLDPARARVMGAAGRARVEREFSWSRVAQGLDAAAAAFRAGWASRAGR